MMMSRSSSSGTTLMSANGRRFRRVVRLPGWRRFSFIVDPTKAKAPQLRGPHSQKKRSGGSKRYFLRFVFIFLPREAFAFPRVPVFFVFIVPPLLKVRRKSAESEGNHGTRCAARVHARERHGRALAFAIARECGVEFPSEPRR